MLKSNMARQPNMGREFWESTAPHPPGCSLGRITVSTAKCGLTASSSNKRRLL